MIIVDGHLDLAYNASRGRNLLLPASRQTPDEEGTPSVGLPDLRAASVTLLCGTLFCMPALGKDAAGYRNHDQAHAAAKHQLQWYHQRHAEAEIQIIRAAGQLTRPPTLNPLPATPQVIILMEGADPIRSPHEVQEWFDAGLRIVGLAWKQTRYAGAAGAPGPLTPQGDDLLRALDAHAIIHDVSHLAEQSFWQLLDTSSGPVIASHSNCRNIVPTDRHLSDQMIRALADRGGMIGINLYTKFLLPPAEAAARPADLQDVVRHIRHVCDVTGDTTHVGLGTDMDGGFGAECLPTQIRSSADLPRLADALSASGFTPPEVEDIMAANWLRFFEHALP